jgi:hypothetical protein
MEEQRSKKSPLVGVAAEYQKIEQEYRRSIALVEARPLFERVLVGAWVAVDVLLALVFFGGILWYLANGMFVEQARATAIFMNANDGQGRGLEHQPASLRVEKPYVMAANSGGTRFDVVAGITNEAERWVAEFKYQFTWSGGESPEYSGFALPGVTFYATALGMETGRPGGAELQVRNIEWRKLDGRVAPDAEAWITEREGFEVQDEVTTEVVALDAGKVSQTSFILANKSSYSYQNPEFVVMIRRAGAPVAVTVVQVPQFEAASTRPVSIGWLTQLPAPVQVDVWPRIPFHDVTAYRSPQGTAERDLRDLFDGSR